MTTQLAKEHHKRLCIRIKSKYDNKLAKCTKLGKHVIPNKRLCMCGKNIRHTILHSDNRKLLRIGVSYIRKIRKMTVIRTTSIIELIGQMNII